MFQSNIWFRDRANRTIPYGSLEFPRDQDWEYSRGTEYRNVRLFRKCFAKHISLIFSFSCRISLWESIHSMVIYRCRSFVLPLDEKGDKKKQRWKREMRESWQEVTRILVENSGFTILRQVSRRNRAGVKENRIGK